MHTEFIWTPIIYTRGVTAFV